MKRNTRSTFDLEAEFRTSLEQLRSICKVHPNSRLAKYLIRLTQINENDTGLISRDLLDHALFNVQEVQEFIEIMRCFPNDPTNDFLERLCELVSGQEISDDEVKDENRSKRSKGRDTQYELYLYTYMLGRSISVELGPYGKNPDIIIKAGGAEYPVEASRPKSRNSLLDAIKAKARQIEKGTYPGLVAISLDHVLRPPEHILHAIDMDDSFHMAQKIFNDFKYQIEQLLRKTISSPLTGGLVWV
jgi:hypothetical protein